MAVVYSSADALRAELGVDEATLSDADAEKLILSAEDITDGMLGRWFTDSTTGRKIVEAEVDAWRWLKLERFTTLLAAYLHLHPGVQGQQRYNTVKGPDFEFSGPLTGGSWVPRSIVAVLNQSGLRRLTTTAWAGRS